MVHGERKSYRTKKLGLVMLQYLHDVRELKTNNSDLKTNSFYDYLLLDAKLLIDFQTRFDSLCLVLGQCLQIMHLNIHVAESLKNVREHNFTRSEPDSMIVTRE